MPTKYQTADEAAARWGVTPRLVRRWCAQGRIRGAIVLGYVWGIPTTAPRPDRIPPGRKPPK